MCDWNIIDEVEATAFTDSDADSDRWLSEGCLAHMDTRTGARAPTASGTATRCSGQNGEQA